MATRTLRSVALLLFASALSLVAPASAVMTMVLCLAATASVAHAAALQAGGGDPFEVFFDEDGNGRVSVDGAPFVPMPGVMAADPASGLIALTYFLPELVIAGDVGVFESPEFTQLSDGMRFTNAQGALTGLVADRMVYFSDNDSVDSNGALADTEFPANFGALGFSGRVDEVGPESGPNGFDWLPGGNIYHGTSDVPEPSTMSLLGLGILGLGGYTVRRRKQVA